MPPEDRQPKAMLVCPWLELREPLNFAGIELMPASIAQERHVALSAAIAAGTSTTYSTGYRPPRCLEDLVEYQRGGDVVFDIEWAKPSVIMVYEDEEVPGARTALDALCFASLAYRASLSLLAQTGAQYPFWRSLLALS
jgi:hypothetical protein